MLQQQQDPLLSRAETIQRLESQLNELKRQQQVRVQVDMPYQQPQPQQPQQKSVWDEISEELNSMPDTQKQVLFQDPEYQEADRAVAAIAAKYQLSLLMPYVANDEEGKKALERQLILIKAKKDGIAKREYEELAEFRRWKEQQARLSKE